MDLNYLDKAEYKKIPIIRIEDNNNGLPFSIKRLNKCTSYIHRHKFVQIIYVSSGKLKHVLNNTNFDVFMGDIFIIPPYVPHYFIDNDTKQYEIIEFEFVPEFIDERFSASNSDCNFMDFAYLEPFLVAENEIISRFNLYGSIHLEVEEIFSEIFKEYDTRASGSELLIRTLLQKLLVLVDREFKKSTVISDSQRLFDKHKEAMYQIKNYIDDNLSNTISAKDVAQMAMFSQSHFRYLFKRMFNKSFVQYINERRIVKAAELLCAQQNMLIIDICYETGFNNVTHFNRVFRQIAGLTPTAFRKTYKNQEVTLSPILHNH